MIRVRLHDRPFFGVESEVEDGATDHILMSDRLFDLADHSVENSRHRGEHGGPQGLEIVHDLPGVALREADSHSIGDAGGLHEVFENVSHREIGDVVVVLAEVAHLVDVALAHRTHRHQVQMGDHRSLRHVGRSGGVADHADVIALHRGQRWVRETPALLKKSVERVEGDGVLVSQLAQFGRDFAACLMGRERRIVR